MVGRLTWRIIQRPSCLMARVLKAKYFPDSSILEFKGKGNSSFLCKSLCWGRDLVKMGIRWQVGSGNIRVFSQPWLPRAGAFHVVTREPEDGFPWCVSDFISEGKWDQDIVRSTMAPYDAEAILRIPLGRVLTTPRGPSPHSGAISPSSELPGEFLPGVFAPEEAAREHAAGAARELPEEAGPLAATSAVPAGAVFEETAPEGVVPADSPPVAPAPGVSCPDDALVWHFEADGAYTVRSGYRLARSSSRTGPSSSTPPDPRWWNTLWSLRVPPKIKHLIWRMWSNVLPTFGALRSRGIPCLPFCKFCGALPEDSLHAIWACPRAQAIWKSSILSRWADKTGDLPLQDLCLRALDSLPRDHLELFCGLAWAAWRDRNCRLFDDVSKCPDIWVEETATWIASFKSALDPPPRTVGENNNHRSKWTGAEDGGLTLNVDASWVAARGLATAGGVIRDANGHVLGVTAVRSGVVDSPLTAECSAILHGLLFAKDRNWPISVIETDCLRATQLLKGKQFNSLQGPLLRNIASLLPLKVLIRWIPRSRNSVAHVLAQSCIPEGVPDLWSSNCPEWLALYVHRDLVP